MQLMAMGIPYARSNKTTEADMIALKALPFVSLNQLIKKGKPVNSYLVEPRKMRPKMMTRTRLRTSEFKGTFKPEWTLAKKREKGRPPSRAKA